MQRSEGCRFLRDGASLGHVRAILASACVVALLISGSASGQVADPTRAIDRVYYGFHAGAGQLALGRLTDSEGFSARGEVSGPKWMAGYDMGIWPMDWLGFEMTLEFLDLSYGRIGGGRGVHFSGFGARYSLSAQLALPLRYVAPRIGVGPALLMPFIWDASDTVTSPGPQFHLRYSVGASVYLTRDLRLIADVHFVQLDFELHRKATETREARTQLFEGASGRYLVLGLAYTPDWVRETTDGTDVFIAPIEVPTLVAIAAVVLAVVQRNNGTAE